MKQFTYLFLDLFTFLGPFALSFDKKVAFYTKFKSLFISISVTALIFIIWDILFTRSGVWGFNPDYLTGLYVYNLPIEEILFFIVVPYACLFIYECCLAYRISFFKERSVERYFYFLAVLILIIGLLNYNKWYTFVTFCGFALFLFISIKKIQNKNEFLSSYIISLIPFLLVNGVLTYLPVVWYNNNENLGIRIISIPIEDTMYGFFLIYLTKLWMDLNKMKRGVGNVL